MHLDAFFCSHSLRFFITFVRYKIIASATEGLVQQLEIRCVRSTNNETRVERNRSTCRQHYGVVVKFGEPIARGFSVLFFLE